MLSILKIIEDTTVDGPGFRTAIYAAGCKHKCKNCHNPHSWDINNGRMMTTQQIMEVINNDPFANVTFTGGDPMFQPDGFIELAKNIKAASSKTIWCYTGFTFEKLLNMPKQRNLISLIDVLVDGPFIEHLKDNDLLFRGSKNQRLIDVKKSLEKGDVVKYLNPMTTAS